MNRKSAEQCHFILQRKLSDSTVPLEYPTAAVLWNFSSNVRCFIRSPVCGLLP